MCCAGFLVKYTLIIANILFALAGIVIIGLGVAVHLQIKDIVDLIPINITGLSISIILIGCLIFVISYLACCGAMRESRCMLIFYALFMSILAGVKIYLTVIIFNFLDSATATVERWIVNAFDRGDSLAGFHLMETLFKCCGTTGANSYSPSAIPTSCCAPENTPCNAENSYRGCTILVADYFEVFGEVIGGILILVIIIEIVCVLLGLYLSNQISKKRYASA